MVRFYREWSISTGNLQSNKASTGNLLKIA